MKNFQKGFGLFGLLIILGIVVLGGGAYLYLQNKQSTVPVNSSPQIATSTSQTSPTPTTQTPTHPDSSFSASPTSGSAPLTVAFNYSFDANAMGAASDQFLMDFGDGTQDANSTGTHTYTSAGTYIATISYKNSVEGPSNYVPLTDRYGNRLTKTITVTNSSQASATIDQNSLISSTTPNLAGTVSGTSDISVCVWRGTLSPSQLDSSNVFWCTNTDVRVPEVYVSNGRWYASPGNSEVAGNGPAVPYFPNGTYTVGVHNFPNSSVGQLLAWGTLQITGPSIEVTRADSSTVSFQYVDLPPNSQILLTGDLDNPPVVATVSGSGSSTISIPNFDGDYWLRVELNGNPNTVLQSGPFSPNDVGR